MAITSSRSLTSRRPRLPRFASRSSTSGQWPDSIPPMRRVIRSGRAARRGATAVIWTLLAVPIQAVLLALPGRAKVGFARLYWAVFAFLIGLNVRVIGARAANGQGRRVIYAANHCSWLDIPVLGGRLDACFVSKDEVARWPGISVGARLGRTVFVSRHRGATGRERDDMRGRLAAGDDLLLFPEGTSSDGTRVLPFRSAFFSIAEGDAPPLIQPISVVYDRLGGLPTRRSTRAVFAWYGDMNLASHFWRLAQWRGMRATVLMHPPLDPADFANRKLLAQAAWDAVAGGAAAMRQNREERAIRPAPGQATGQLVQARVCRSRCCVRTPPNRGGTGPVAPPTTKEGKTPMGLFSKPIKTLDDLFVHTLQDIYYAENQISKTLPTMIGKATEPRLKGAFETHLKETEVQIARLETVFSMHGQPVKGVTCAAMDGILAEGKELIGEVGDPQVLDAAMLSSAQAIEHYEITRYGTLVALAKQLGRPDCASVLQQTLEEEKATDKKLSELAESQINRQAA